MSSSHARIYALKQIQNVLDEPELTIKEPHSIRWLGLKDVVWDIFVFALGNTPGFHLIRAKVCSIFKLKFALNIPYYCKFGNFRVTFISRIFYFPIISETLNSRSSTRAVYKAYSNSLLARTLFSRGNEFANISEN